MLKVFREKRESLKWVLWLLIVVLGAGMMLLFVDAPTGAAGLLLNEVARVGDESIGVAEFQRHRNQLVEIYRQQLGDNFPKFAPQMNLPGQAVNSLITERSIALHARSLGLEATAPEISERVLSIPVFKDEQGNFVGKERYQAVLRANGLTLTEFEDNIRREILRDRLQHLLTAGLGVTPSDLRREFAKQEQQTRIQYVLFDPDTLSPEPDQEELQEFFDQNAEAYQAQEQRRIKYFEIFLKPDEVELSEAQIIERMESLDSKEQIRASQILFKTKPNQDDLEQLALANRVLRQLKRGASFEQLARRHSEHESAARGGDMGFFPRGVQDKDFDKAAFDLKQGELSEIVQTAFGYHLIKVTSRPTTMEELRRKLADQQLREELSNDTARKRAQEILTRLKGQATWKDVAAEEGLEIKTSEFFPRSETVKDPPVRSDFNVEAYNLSKDDFFEQPYLTPSGYLVPQVAEIQASQIPDLEEVKDRVKEDYIEQKRVELNRNRADSFFEAASKSSLEEVAAEQDLKVTTTRFFKNGETVDDVVQFSPIMHQRIEWMQKGDVSSPIRVANKVIVFEIGEKSELDEATFELRRPQIEDTLTSTARNSFFSGYLRNVVDQLREDDQIIINQELVDQFSIN